MSKPQQPEIARSGHGATDPGAVKTELTAPVKGGGAEPDAGPVPEDNQPGHHPEQDQDKPTGEAFLKKMHEHAAEVHADREAAEAAEVAEVAVTAEAAAGPSAETRREPAEADEQQADPTVVGDVARAAAGVVRKVREVLPGS